MCDYMDQQIDHKLNKGCIGKHAMDILQIDPYGGFEKKSLKTAEFVSVSWEFGLAFLSRYCVNFDDDDLYANVYVERMVGELRKILVSSHFVVGQAYTGWWFQIFYMFNPILGKKSLILTHFFQIGWFNHHLYKRVVESKTPSDSRRSLVALTLSAWHNFFESNCRCGYSDAWLNEVKHRNTRLKVKRRN